MLLLRRTDEAGPETLYIGDVIDKEVVEAAVFLLLVEVVCVRTDSVDDDDESLKIFGQFFGFFTLNILCCCILSCALLTVFVFTYFL